MISKERLNSGYQIPRARCCLCSETKPVACYVLKGKRCRKGTVGCEPVCHYCYKTKINIATCSVCKRPNRPIAARNPPGDPNGKPVCTSCHQAEVCSEPNWKECFYCEEERAVTARTESGEAVCQNCYQEHMHRAKCFQCGIDKPIHARLIIGDPNSPPLCQACDKRRRRAQKKLNSST